MQFTAAQAAQKSTTSQTLNQDMFTAAQAAQNLQEILIKGNEAERKEARALLKKVSKVKQVLMEF